MKPISCHHRRGIFNSRKCGTLALLVLSLWLVGRPIYQAQQGPIAGVQIKPENILFTGNKAISSDQLRAIFRNSGTVTAGLSPSQMDTYSADRITHAVNMLLAFYRNRGFIRATVSSPQMDFVTQEGASRLTMLFNINEDHIYLLGQVKIRGARTFTEPSLSAMLNLQPDIPLSMAKLDSGVFTIQKSYLSLGFLDVEVKSSLDAQEIRKKADILIDITEGAQYHVGRVELIGNSPVSNLLLREFLPLQQGDVFGEKTFEACLQYLNNVGITPVLTASDVTFEYNRPKGEVDLVIHLEGNAKK
jgi:outer membrane protein assembly factor BamA